MSRSRILAVVEFVAPDDDRLEGQRAFAQAGDHRLAAGLDALGDGDFALARQQLDRAHLAQVHAHRIVGALDRLGAAGGDRGGARRLDEFAAARPPLRRRRLGGFLLRLLGVLAVDDVDAHLAEHRVHVFDLIGGDLLRRQHRVQLVLGDPAALLGDLDHPLDGGVGQIEQRAVGGFHDRPLRLRPSARRSSPFRRLHRIRARAARPPPGVGRVRSNSNARGGIERRFAVDRRPNPASNPSGGSDRACPLSGRPPRQTPRSPPRRSPNRPNSP